MDLFDAADLLAIEQDAQSSSSSSCSDSAANSGSHEAADGDKIMEDRSHPRVGDGNTLPTKQSEQFNNGSDSSVDGFCGDDKDSSDGESDGFLESMLTLENANTKQMHQPLETKELLQEEPEPVPKGASHRCLNNDNNDNGAQSVGGSDKVAIQLGNSVCKWINHKAPRENPTEKHGKNNTCEYYDGVISIQSKGNKLNDDGQASAHYLSIGKKRKRQSATGRDVAVATLEHTHSKGNKQCGQASFAPYAERASLGTMVDCLARYDREKGVYVLEIADLDVSGLSEKTPEDYDDRKDDKRAENNDDTTAVMEQSTSTIVDPRLRAKQAEKQVRKLKQRKSRQV